MSLLFSLYLKVNGTATAVVLGALVVFVALAVYAYDPARGMMSRKRVGNG